MTRALMFMGTGSGVGKSMLVTGLCRLLARRGMAVAPFKPQNMSNNAAVAADGGEIGRSQALQALAALRPASIHMNPVLLKPQAGQDAQLIVRGERRQIPAGQTYQHYKKQLMPEVLESFAHLASGAEMILAEGAGSASEINMRRDDIANMGFAAAADLPVVMIGDIERGGVIAALAGTRAVLAPADSDRIAGFCINKFCGDPALFAEGMEMLAAHTGWAGLGIVPWFDPARLLPAEDGMDLAAKEQAAADKASASGAGQGNGRPLHICVPVLPGIANFDDLDPLLAEPAIRLSFLRDGAALPADCDLVILPGSKSTLTDLQYLHQSGWAGDILAHVRRGGHLLGICGGFQMLGRKLLDPMQIESRLVEMPGLGLLAIETVLGQQKTTRQTRLVTADGTAAASGYEIHLGKTSGEDCQRPFFAGGHGAVSPDGRVAGCYLHGLFDEAEFRRWYFARFNQPVSPVDHGDQLELILDQLADHLEASLDIEALLKLARPLPG